MNSDQRQEYIRALLIEREGAVRYGKTDTVSEIDAELRKVGHEAAAPRERAERMTRPPADLTANEARAQADLPPVKRGPGRPRKNPKE